MIASIPGGFATGFAPSQVGEEEVLKILNADSTNSEQQKGPPLKVDDFVRVAAEVQAEI